MDVLKGYLAAVSTSVTIALSIRYMVKRMTGNMRGGKMYFFNTLSSFIACAMAGSSNLFWMRRTELQKGIDIVDDDHNSVGKS